MSSQFFKCPRCQMPNVAGSQFCNKCGASFQAQKTQNNNRLPAWAIGVIALFSVIAICGMCGVIGKLSDQKKNNIEQVANTQPANVAATPAPTPAPLTFAELKAKAQPLLKFPDRAEYTVEELKPFDEVMKGLREIPKEAKEYKEAQKLFDQLNKKLSVFLAEILVLGPKPTNSAYDGNVAPAQEYLKQALNDYDSSEYLGWTNVQKTYIGSEPYWTTSARIRAKNAFGAFVVNEFTFYIRNNQVVKVDD